MAKETAHQLGTPLSSLMAWLEILKSQGVEESSLLEMNKDIVRLETVSDRFSKIGSASKKDEANVYDVIHHSIDYLRSRVSKKVNISIRCHDKKIHSLMNISLFEWVIENLTKNAVDAMAGEGDIVYTISKENESVIIEVSDTGKGIPSSKLKTVFEPGYTTKKRGWGLGLSLVKRIIEEHHNGKITVKNSQIDQGTIFRIVL
jgi:two-component system, sporulation sensor kinase D